MLLLTKRCGADERDFGSSDGGQGVYRGGGDAEREADDSDGGPKLLGSGQVPLIPRPVATFVPKVSK